jgi:hypothetical protein
MTWTRLVLLDGVWVPTAAVTCEWTDKGASGCTIVLVPSKEASQILPSTHVQVFHVEAGLAAKRKQVVDLPTDNSLTDRSMFAAECGETLGDTFFPEIDPGGDSEHWANRMPFYSMHLRFAGEVMSVAESESAGQGATTQLTCRGYDHLMDSVKAIQLTRGRGTLAEQERGFFGQQEPVFTGSGRNAFFDGIAQILEQSEYGLAETCRRLASVYPARLNTWAAHRFAWTRLADQICSVDGDTTTERLLGTNAFSRYLRDAIQQQYALPLRAVIAELLNFVSYRMIAIPSPCFFPLHKPLSSVTEEETSTSRVVEEGYDYASVVVPAGNGLPGITAECRIRNGTRFDLYVPEGINGGPKSYTVQLEGISARMPGSSVADKVTIQEMPAAERRTTATPAVFVVGAVYAVDLTDQHESTLEPYVVKATIYREPRRVETSTTAREVVTDVPPEDPQALNAEWARLASYAIVPHLWWACPPACNVVIPDEIISWSLQDPGANNLTRLLAKISPGRSGSSRVLMDKFVAPNRLELNQGAADPEDDTTDPSRHLYRSEYINGPQADVYYFERLHRFVGDDDWETYLSSFISTEFWNRRLGAKSATLTMRNSIRPVVGAPMLIIRGTGSLQTAASDPEQLHWLARLRNLQALIRRLSDARSRLSGNVNAARRLTELARLMYSVRVISEGLPAEGSDPALRLGQDQVALVEDEAQTITELHTKLVESNVSGGVVSSQSLDGNITRFNINGGGGSGYEATIRSLITTEPDKAVEAFSSSFPAANTWTRSLLRQWIQEIEDNTVDYSPCRAALAVDIGALESALEECRSALRSLVTEETDDPSYLGYVSSVSESSSPGGNTLTVALTHVRRVGEDLDWDGLGGDDPEALIAFGPDGYMDEQYRADQIGDKVYRPIYGCGAISDLDIAVAQQQVEQEQATDVPGLPPIDGSDVELTHLAVCGRDYSDADTATTDVSTSTTTAAARSLISAYRAKVSVGAQSEDLFRWLENIRVRATATPTDLYRGLPVLMTRTGGRSEPVDVRDGEETAYQGESRLEGFFARSFLAGDVDFERVRVVSLNAEGEEVEVTLTDDEKDLLQDRVRRVQAYVESVSSKTFSRTG